MESALYESQPDDLKIIETLGFRPEEGFGRLGLHLDRAERTAGLLGFPFDRGLCLQTLGESVADTSARVRLTIDRDGNVDVTTGDLAPNPSVWRIAVSETRLRSDDPWLAVKTTNRALYDTERQALPEGMDEFIYLNEKDFVCEGAITTIFAERGGILVTPATGAGLLPGILRQEMLETEQAVKGDLTLGDLKRADRLFVGNSLRGLIQAELVSLGL